MTVREADEYLFGEEWARINALPLEQRIEVLCDYWDSFDTAADLFWPEEPPPGAPGRARFSLWGTSDIPVANAKPVTA